MMRSPGAPKGGWPVTGWRISSARGEIKQASPGSRPAHNVWALRAVAAITSPQERTGWASGVQVASGVTVGVGGGGVGVTVGREATVGMAAPPPAQPIAMSSMSSPGIRASLREIMRASCAAHKPAGADAFTPKCTPHPGAAKTALLPRGAGKTCRELRRASPLAPLYRRIKWRGAGGEGVATRSGPRPPSPAPGIPRSGHAPCSAPIPRRCAA